MSCTREQGQDIPPPEVPDLLVLVLEPTAASTFTKLLTPSKFTGELGLLGRLECLGTTWEYQTLYTPTCQITVYATMNTPYACR